MSACDHSSNHHHHHHQHNAMAYNSAFIIAIVANSLFVILQIVYAYIASSTSLLADAFHNLGDVLGLVFSWIATRLMQKRPTSKRTYGMKKISILAALVNGTLLVFTCGIIASEALYQLFTPRMVASSYVMVVASIGIFVNGATALLFLRGSHDLNVRSAFLHLLYDALISIGVVLGAFVLSITHWLWLDPLIGLLIALIILKGTWYLFKESFSLIIDAVPPSISWDKVREFFAKKSGVEGVHDLHIWALSTTENALSVHLYMPSSELLDEERGCWIDELKTHYGIQHVTIQVEKSATACNDTFCKAL